MRRVLKSLGFLRVALTLFLIFCGFVLGRLISPAKETGRVPSSYLLHRGVVRSEPSARRRNRMVPIPRIREPALARIRQGSSPVVGSTTAGIHLNNGETLKERIERADRISSTGRR